MSTEYKEVELTMENLHSVQFRLTPKGRRIEELVKQGKSREEALRQVEENK